MFQPFEKFKAAYIPKLLDLNKRYLVSQGYKAAYNHFDELHKTDILLSDYSGMGEAELHKKAVRHDPYAAILDLKNEQHVAKLQEMLAEDSQYNLYWAIVESREKTKRRLDAKYKDHIRRYLSNNTRWSIGAGEKIATVLQVIYGELHLFIKRGNQTLRVKFEDIENA